MASTGEAPIIIKKVKKGGGHGHHGGAWKVAYADFVTAMMAFFLLMWLLNTTSPEQKQGIADYFAPASISSSTRFHAGLRGLSAKSTPQVVGDAARRMFARVVIWPSTLHRQGGSFQWWSSPDRLPEMRRRWPRRVS